MPGSVTVAAAGVVRGKKRRNPHTSHDGDDRAPDRMTGGNGILRLARLFARDHGERDVLPMPKRMPRQPSQVHHDDGKQSPSKDLVQFLEAPHRHIRCPR